MAQDVIKPKGALKRSKADAGGTNPRMTPALGIVKDNVDPTRSGRLMVYIVDNSGIDPDNKDNWRPVKFLSPFFGFTRPDAGDTDLGTYKTNPSSYGMWMSPPDIGTTVLCLFVDGDMNYGFYIGCVPEPEALQMVPAIGAVDNIIPNKGEADSYGGAKRLPVTNINTNNKDVADSSQYLTAPKPVHSYSSAIMFQQGILRDPVRGPIGSSSQRESPSRVGWGVSTPGRPIYEGGFDDTSIASNLKADNAKQLRVVARRGGHTIVMDDGDIIGRDQLIRIRTSLGHQILMSDDGQTLMLLHSNGQSYIELGKEGTIDLYSTNSVNIRTQGDLNLHADNDVNIHATKNLNLQGENIHINSEKEYKQRVGSNYSNFTSGKHTTKVGGAYSVESGGQASMASSAEAFVNGSKVNLNSGQTSTKPQEVPAIEKTLHTDTLFDKQKGFLAAPAKLVSITSRAPAHTPWANAGQGVDVKTTISASSALPSAPANSVKNTNNKAASALSGKPSSAVTNTVPSSKGTSTSINSKVSSAIAGAQSQKAGKGPLKDAVKKGAAIADVPGNSPTIAVGKYALTADQLQVAGALKPGSGPLITSLAGQSGNVKVSMGQNLFTGYSGAQNLPSLVSNTQAQTQLMTNNFQQAQTQLQAAGVISGKEVSTQLGGMVLSTSKNGLSKTLDAVNAGALSKLGVNSSFSGLDNVMDDIGAGNFGAGIGEGLDSTLSGLNNSVQALAKSPSLSDVIDTAKGVSAGAFSAIAASFKPMEAGKPQNLTAIAKQAAVDNALASVSDTTNSLSQAAQSTLQQTGANVGLGSNVLPNSGTIADSLVNASKGLASVGSSVLSNATGQLSKFANSPTMSAGAFASPTSLLNNPTATNGLIDAAKAKATGLVSGTVSSLASGLSNLPGGAAAAGSITNLAKGGMPNMPGIGDLKSAITGSQAGALTGLAGELLGKAGDLLSKAKAQAGGLSSLVSSGLPAGAASELQNALGSVASPGSGVKMPSVALNTVDRSELTDSVASTLDDPDIPPPKFGEIDEAAASEVDSATEERNAYIDEQDMLTEELNDAEDEASFAESEYLDAQNNYPPGDPEIISLKAAWDASIAKVQKALDALKKLDEKYPSIALAEYGNSTQESDAVSNNNTNVTVIKRTVIKGSA